MKYLIYPLYLLWALTFSACERIDGDKPSEPMKIVSDVPMDEESSIHVSNTQHTIRLTVSNYRGVALDWSAWKIDDLPIQLREIEVRRFDRVKVEWVESWVQGNVVVVRIQPNDTGKPRKLRVCLMIMHLGEVVTIHQAAN